ncbi:uncharacterized protein LOC132610722 isoform X1 [Lycium barbarum]|uniref:uncharacterized protein LOC132610722 isoform X1 n=1 Tax=Lycium barbarum TaxID=112863 RepID=UPI00293E0F42|nr:uncharacterized protein LOC132610722 isoform X1 [Lycium barbarum]
MGKNQITTKNTESQGVCEKIFRAVNISPAFRSLRRISTVHPQTQHPKSASTNSATKPIVASADHHINDPAKATKFKLVAQSGSTIPLDQLNGKQIPLQEKNQNLSSAASNMVRVEYNHRAGESATPKFKPESLKPVNKLHQQNQDPYKGTKVEPHVNKSPVKNMFTTVRYQINEGPKDDSNERFSNYIDHVKNKMINTSSFDDDHKVSHYVGRSKFKT